VSRSVVVKNLNLKVGLVVVKVEVLDINDNTPVIELAAGGIQLYESAELNTMLFHTSRGFSVI